MKPLSWCLRMEDRVVLISIHPDYVNKILSGEKRLEFRRIWTATPAKSLVIYATSPVQRIVALAEIKKVYVGSKTKLWDLSQKMGGGISRRKLFSYLAGKKNPVAIGLAEVQEISGGLDPKKIFGKDFRPPQSFCYLNKDAYLQILKQIQP